LAPARNGANHLPDDLRLDLPLFLLEIPRLDEERFRRFGDFFGLSFSGSANMVPPFI
jgi:hypothetical protein